MKTRKKRCCSVMLALVMLFGLLPLSALPAAAAEPTVKTVTPETFFSFFDESGTLKDEDADELQFSGDFSGVGVNYVTVDRSVTLSSPDKAQIHCPCPTSSTAIVSWFR